MLESNIRNEILFENHEDNFDERHNLSDRFKVIYFK
jgi:hypothetical protein